jgi:peptide deformylase
MAKLVPQSHAALHAIAEEVPVKDIASATIKKVIKDMRAALHSYKSEGFTGVAIAAPQIGVPLRIFLVEDTSTTREEDEELLPSLVAINPKIIKLSRTKTLLSEGCLSVPDEYGKVTRSTHTTLRAYDEEGREYERGASGLLAQIFQHEVDHLDGILFIDRAEEIYSKAELEKMRTAESK